MAKKVLTDLNATGRTITATTFSGDLSGTVDGVTFSGTAATTMTLPSTTATLARTDAAQTFTGNQTFSGQVITNGNIGPTGTTALTIYTANQSSTTVSSNIIMRSGNQTGTAVSGNVTVTTGTAAAANTGSMTIGSGGATNGNSGNVSILSGTSTTAGNSGSVHINVGTIGTGSKGSINIGNAGVSNTVAPSAITIGATGVPITLAGDTTSSGAVTLRAGTATAGTAPLYLQSGTNLTAAATGAVEYDGKAAYFTTSSTTGRGLVPSSFLYKTNSTTQIAAPTNGGSAVPNMFGTISLLASTTYEIEMLLILNFSATVGSGYHVVQFGGGAVPSATQMYVTFSSGTSNFSTAVAQTSILYTGTTSFPSFDGVFIPTSGGNYYRAFVKGFITINTAGGFAPRMNLSAGASPASATGSINAGSYIKLTPIGSNSVSTIGTWTA